VEKMQINLVIQQNDANQQASLQKLFGHSLRKMGDNYSFGQKFRAIKELPSSDDKAGITKFRRAKLIKNINLNQK